MEDNMSAKEAIDLISSVTKEVHRDTHSVLAWYMLIWGCIVAFTSLLVGHMWHATGCASWNWLWLAMTIAGFGITTYYNRKKAYHIPHTPTTYNIGLVWTVIGGACLLIGFFGSPMAAFCHELIAPLGITGSNVHMVPLTVVMIPLFGVGAAFTGILLRDWFISLCGVVAGFCGFVGGMVFEGAYALVVLAMVTTVSMVVPALRILIKERVVCTNR